MRTVQRGYIGSTRVIVDNTGLVYDVKSDSWAPPTTPVTRVAGSYARWVDVPAAWLGFSPWWK